MPASIVHRRAAATLACATIMLCVSPAPADTPPGIGAFVWFDSAVWSVRTADQWESTIPDCVHELGQKKYLRPQGPTATVFSDHEGAGFTNLQALMRDTASMPAGAVLNNGNVFLIATSLDPTGTSEFRPGSTVRSSDFPACLGSSFEQAMERTFTAFYDATKGLLNPGNGEAAVPVSLMFSSFRTLRFGRILSSAQHLDPTDGVYFGGLTAMNSAQSSRLAPTDNDEEKALGSGIWSIYWPENATASTQDDVDIVLNYVDRCIEFAAFCNTKGGLGSSPVIDVYLDLELFQLSHVSPLELKKTKKFGTQYPGITDMPEPCRENMGWGDTPDPYWSAPANVADAFWRTLRICRSKIDAYNSTRSGSDVELTLSVWSQEAYRFCSPRFGIEDTTTSADSFDPTTGRFDQPFGTARIKRRNGGTDEAPTYADPEDWTCDCARLDPSAGAGDKDYAMTPPAIDDFNINNCIFQFVDRVAYGTYQSVPVGLVNVKKNFRNNTAVDFVGTPMKTTKPAKEILPGDGVPLGGASSTTPINFGQTATFAPTTQQADNGLLPDGGWLLNPPKSSWNQNGTWCPYYYNPIGAWPPWAQPGDRQPDWSGPPSGLRSDPWDCASYWGSYDMPFQGWLPFAARMLHSIDRWGTLNQGSNPPTAIMTLELTPLSDGQAGGVGACFKNSLGNEWVWGSATDDDCATGTTGDWPTVLIDDLCQADRVTYLFGGGASTTTSGGDLTVGNAWGFAPASRFFNSQNGPSGAPLASHLDAHTPYALNNNMSYHCLMTHTYMPGYYTKATNFGVIDPSTGERGCWSPYDLDPQHQNKPKFPSCGCPSATQHASAVTTVLYHLGTPGDTTGDDDADIMDLLAVIDRWGDSCPRPCILDHDDDGVIGSGDLLDVIQHWGEDWN